MAHHCLFQSIGPILIAVRVGHETPLPTDVGTSRTRSRSRVLSHLTLRRAVRQNDSLDVENESSDLGDSRPALCVEREDNNQHIEKVTDRSSDATS